MFKDKKYEVFFGDKGITMTSANHLCNLAKEEILQMESYLKNVSFIRETLTSISSNYNPTIIKNGLDLEESRKIITYIKTIGKYKGFIAWLSEARKAKDNILNNFRSNVYEYFSLENDLKFPSMPLNAQTLSFDDVLYSFLNVKELNRYFYLQSFAAEIGTHIHPGGSLSNARENAVNRVLNPISLNLTHQIKVESTLTISNDDIDGLYFSLQKLHRELNAELNSIKYRVEEEMKRLNSLESERYLKESDEYLILRKEYEIKVDRWRDLYLKKIQNLKIIIPNEFQEVFDYLNSLGQ